MKNPPSPLSIVICAYNGLEYTKLLLEAEPPRLGTQAIEPRQPQPLHPARRVRLQARIRVKRKAHGQNHTAPYQVFVLMHPRLLLRRSESYPDEIR